jgi:DNA repair exonuclease SbcCD ATPase subunit
MAVMLPDKWSQLKLHSIGKADPAEQERLLKLFWNRAELKKELQDLDDQLHNLRNKLKQQENANARLQQQLEQLEVLLGNPERGVDALVHFGLKALWRASREQLEKFCSELKRERQDGERRQQLAEFQADRADRLKVADERLRQAQEVADAERERMREFEARMARLQRFWHYFKRRELAAEILAQQERCSAASATWET